MSAQAASSARMKSAKPWRWNRQQRRAAVAIAGVLIGGLSRVHHLPLSLQFHALERGQALAGQAVTRARSIVMTSERRRLEVERRLREPLEAFLEGFASGMDAEMPQ